MRAASTMITPTSTPMAGAGRRGRALLRIATGASLIGVLLAGGGSANASAYVIQDIALSPDGSKVVAMATDNGILAPFDTVRIWTTNCRQPREGQTRHEAREGKPAHRPPPRPGRRAPRARRDPGREHARKGTGGARHLRQRPVPRSPAPVRTHALRAKIRLRLPHVPRGTTVRIVLSQGGSSAAVTFRVV